MYMKVTVWLNKTKIETHANMEIKVLLKQLSKKVACYAYGF